MKLAFIIDSKKNIGGGEYAQFKFAIELAKLGHEILIFAGDKNFLSNELKGQKNLIIKYRKTVPLIKKRVGLGKLDKFWSKTYYSLYVKREIKKFNPDWIIGYLRESAIKAQSLGEELNIKVANFIFENPKWMEEDLGNLWEEELNNKEFAKSWERTKIAYLKSNILIPNSKLSGKKCKEWIHEARISEPVYPGIEAPKPKNMKRDIDIIYIGRLNKLKNINELLEACKGNKYKICIVGKGEEEQNLKNQANKLNLNVNFKGAVSDSEKWVMLNRSKLLVFPTSHEGFGMPPLEALSMGCNVLCSNIPIFKEIYKNEVKYFTLHNVEEMKRRIKSLLKSVPRKTNITKKYSWKKSAKKIEDVLK